MSIFYLMFLIFCFSCQGQARFEKNTEKSDLLSGMIADTFKIVTSADTLSMADAPSRITRKIRLDNRGHLLFASFDDVIQFDGKRFNKIPKTHSLNQFDAFDAYQAKTGAIWIASTHFGVFRYDGEEYAHFDVKNGLAGDRAMCIHEDDGGRIWIGTEEGISLFDRISIQNYTSKNGLANHDINIIAEDKHGRIWVGTRGSLFVYDPSTSKETDDVIFKEFTTDNGKFFGNIWSIIEDREGHIWLGGQRGLWRVNGRTATKMSDFSITGACQDKSGNVWFTHQMHTPHSAGLSCFDMESLSAQNPQATQVFVGDGMFFGLCADRQGGIWVGTLNSVFRYDGNTIVYFNDDGRKSD